MIFNLCKGFFFFTEIIFPADYPSSVTISVVHINYGQCSTLSDNHSMSKYFLGPLYANLLCSGMSVRN